MHSGAAYPLAEMINYAKEIQADGVRLIALGFNGSNFIFGKVTLDSMTNEVHEVS